MPKVFRWHVSRLYDEDIYERGSPRYVEFSVTPESPQGFPHDSKQEPKKAAELPFDDLTWWDTDEDHQIDGKVDYGIMLNAFIQKNAFKDQSPGATAAESRGIAEGMVFLQFVRSDAKLQKALDTVKADPAVPDLSPLVELKDADWLDFTQQARRLSATLYRQVLGKEKGNNDERK